MNHHISIGDVHDDVVHGITLQKALHLLTETEIGKNALLHYLSSINVRPLQALANSALVYANLLHASISPRVAEGKLSLATAKWAMAPYRPSDLGPQPVGPVKYWNLLPHDIRREEAFACVSCSNPAFSISSHRNCRK